MYLGKYVYAIIVAGGRGERFASDGGAVGQPKLFHKINAMPVLSMSAKLVQDNPLVDAAVMVINEEYVDLWADIAKTYQLSKFITVAGGDTRQKSVLAGVLACRDCGGDDGSIVIVHDGARPLTPQHCFDEAVAAAYIYGGAIAAIPVTDTLKACKGVNTPSTFQPTATNSPSIHQTIPRANVYSAQTPQAFHLSILHDALIAAENDGYTGTDDSELVERLGHDVRIVDGSPINIKITRPVDIITAETYLKHVQGR
ncbi:MAG: 2-C-methyl-D-erythritol 4-phosphate cytidylyltransferase [Defluviitaleaceae bacterium]|nr:2-C-methyl-D-erythritol 4-phosphate cytidylyltransferase [Defluviitaleaceae bacterium]